MKILGGIKSYKGKVGCLNCDYIDILYIKKGTTTTEYLERMKPSCGKCGCRETIRMYVEYAATKDLVKEFVMAAQHLEHSSEEEGKEHGHQYG